MAKIIRLIENKFKSTQDKKTCMLAIAQSFFALYNFNFFNVRTDEMMDAGNSADKGAGGGGGGTDKY